MRYSDPSFPSSRQIHPCFARSEPPHSIVVPVIKRYGTIRCGQGPQSDGAGPFRDSWHAAARWSTAVGSPPIVLTTPGD